MSRFGLGMMGDFEDDPFFGSHVRQMNQMMNSMFADPFGLVGPPAALTADPRHQQQQQQQQVAMGSMMPGMQMMPFGFPMMPSLPMGRMFAGLGNMNQDGSCHSFTSSSIMTMTSSGPDGRPQVYQETMSTRSAPGGVKETKKTVSDSRTGTRSLAIGHHIGERAHILEREQNLHSGEREERQEFINLDEEEAETFNHEWEARTKRSAGAIAGSLHRTAARNPYSRSLTENKPLALPSSSTSTSQPPKSQSRPIARPRPSIRPNKSSCRSAESTASTSTDPKTTWTPSPERDSKSEDAAATTATTATATTTARSSSSRKREHSPEPAETALETAASPNKRLEQSRPDQDPIPCIDVTD